MSDSQTRAPGAFFGRRKGRPLREQQSIALDAGIARYGIDILQPAVACVEDLFTAKVGSVRLEIGFGGGEHLLYRAREKPFAGHIGVEPFVNGLAKVTALLAAEPKPNVRLFHQDATLLLDWLAPASLSAIDLLYPDPWPKKKHWKRRFVSAANLDRFARVLRPGAAFRVASDIESYINWTLLACRAHRAFRWQAASANDWNRPFPGWPGTRYEAKALREGRRPAYLTFIRI